MAEMGLNRVYVIALEQWSDEVINQSAKNSYQNLDRESRNDSGSSRVSQIDLTKCHLV